MMFCKLVEQETGFKVEKEFKFHSSRKWRFDYAILEFKIAIEIDGGIWTNGRHTRGKGYLNDMEKFNVASSLGWLILKFTPNNQYSLKTIELIKDTLKQKKI